MIVSTNLEASSLSKWNPTENRAAIIDFIAEVSRPKSPNYVPPEERVAVFDNDGTILCEKPNYTQMQFAVDRIKVNFPDHPEWKELAHICNLVEAPREAPVTLTGQKWLDVFMLSSSNVTVKDYRTDVIEWFDVARHPRYGTRYSSLTYSPMIELIQYLQENEFQVYLVTGGSIDFLRPWISQTYGIPRERIIGSRMEMKYEVSQTEGPTLVNQEKIARFNNGRYKPVSIHEGIGRKPILAVGNSDGDIEMLEWTRSGQGLRMGIVLLHDDAKREYAYDQESKVYDIAKERNWNVVSMKKDFREVFSSDVTQRAQN